jgi:hypothetical protein
LTLKKKTRATAGGVPPTVRGEDSVVLRGLNFGDADIRGCLNIRASSPEYFFARYDLGPAGVPGFSLPERGQRWG